MRCEKCTRLWGVRRVVTRRGLVTEHAHLCSRCRGETVGNPTALVRPVPQVMPVCPVCEAHPQTQDGGICRQCRSKLAAWARNRAHRPPAAHTRLAATLRHATVVSLQRSPHAEALLAIRAELLEEAERAAACPACQAEPATSTGVCTRCTRMVYSKAYDRPRSPPARNSATAAALRHIDLTHTDTWAIGAQVRRLRAMQDAAELGEEARHVG